MLCPVINNPASCKIRSVVCFLPAKNMTAVEIHLELCMIYGRNVMSEGNVKQWCRIFITSYFIT
jgi:hypothetical protein